MPNLPVDHSENAAVVTNEKGGKHSALAASYHLLPPFALTLVAQVLNYGAEKYGEWNWRALHSDDHVNHALGHFLGAIAEDDQAKTLNQSSRINHLTNAATRALFALEAAYLEELNASALSPAIYRRGDATPTERHPSEPSSSDGYGDGHSGITASVGSLGSASLSRRR